MDSLETANLPAVDPKGIELAPAMPGKLGQVASPIITLGELRDFAIPRYWDQLSSIRDAQGELDGDQSRDRELKDRAKVNQYSSAAFKKVAEVAGWDAPAKTALDAAWVKANKHAKTNRKPRAEIDRARKHLSQLEKIKAGAANPDTRYATKSVKCEQRKPFARMLDAAIDRNGLSLTELATKFGVTYLKLWKWKNGEDEPSDDAEKIVKKLAIFLGLSGKELWGLRATLPKRVSWPTDFPNCRKARDRVIRKCPGLAALSPKEQEAKIWEAHSQHSSAPKRNKKHRLSRDMKKWPRPLAAELSAMLEVKLNRSEPILQY